MMGIMLPLACILGEGIPLTVFILCNCLLRINSSFEFRTAAVGDSSVTGLYRGELEQSDR